MLVKGGGERRRTACTLHTLRTLCTPMHPMRMPRAYMPHALTPCTPHPPVCAHPMPGALHDERLRLLSEAAQRELRDAAAAAEALEGRKASSAKGLGGALSSGDLMSVGAGVAAGLNPLAGLLGSVQPVLGRMLRALRSTKRMLIWTDRALTLWLLLVGHTGLQPRAGIPQTPGRPATHTLEPSVAQSLLALSSTLALLGLLVPWEPLIRWGARLAGALLRGLYSLWPCVLWLYLLWLYVLWLYVLWLYSLQALCCLGRICSSSVDGSIGMPPQPPQRRLANPIPKPNPNPTPNHRRAAAAAAKEEAYQSADPSGRIAMLRAVGDEVGATLTMALLPMANPSSYG